VEPKEQLSSGAVETLIFHQEQKWEIHWQVNFSVLGGQDVDTGHGGEGKG
jgi:hypothetical protein